MIKTYFSLIDDFEMTLEEALSMSPSGSCDNDIAIGREIPHIKKQLEKIDAVELIEELRGYGCWEDSELEDHDANLSRILWIAAGDIIDGK
jgi:hypothetical protein